jgi:hypothetical protein
MLNHVQKLLESKERSTEYREGRQRKERGKEGVDRENKDTTEE